MFCKNELRNFSDINFSYMGKLYFLLVIRVYFDENFIYSKVQAAKVMFKVSSLLTLFNTRY